jgi:hypothetical protein
MVMVFKRRTNLAIFPFPLDRVYGFFFFQGLSFSLDFPPGG